ncbi:MAG: cohesin domain-containing protein [Hespellia sp.]|nr:cohesin domain-containing protein [Hespellia sp.]
MNTKKKICAALLSICLLAPCFSMISMAAEGTLQFSDPTTTNGAEFTVDVKMNTAGEAIGDGNVNVTYDPAMLEFINGTNATGGNGSVALSTTGDGTVSELAYSMTFKALAEGTATIDVSNYTAYLYNDETLTLSTGNSTVTIGAGDGTSTTAQTPGATASGDSLSVEVDGTSYTINENFSEAIIPSGYTASELEIEGVNRKCMVDSAEHYLFYLQDANGTSDYFLYNSSNATFQKTEMIDISDERTVFLMDPTASAKLPSQFKETTMSVNGKDFKAWQNTEDTEFFLVYARCNDGTESYYQYDSVQSTYQRYSVPTTTTDQTKKGLSDKISDLINDKLPIVLAVVWGIFLLLLIIIVVIAVKLSHRNQELDDLYDEYDIPEASDEIVSAKKADRKISKSKQKKNDEYFDDEEYDDDGYDDDEYYDDDEEYDDDEYDDDFKVDFIDLD